VLHDYALYKSTFTLLYFTLCAWIRMTDSTRFSSMDDLAAVAVLSTLANVRSAFAVVTVTGRIAKMRSSMRMFGSGTARDEQLSRANNYGCIINLGTFFLATVSGAN